MKPLRGNDADEARWWSDGLLLCAIVTFVAWSALSLTWPLSGDAGVFAWMGDTVLQGRAPYTAAWDTKGPGSWIPTMLMQLLVGRAAWGIRAFDIAMVIAAVLAIRAIAARLGLPGKGRVAAALYLLWYANLTFWSSSQPDGWVAAWLIVACSLVLTRGVTGAVVAGMLLGVAVLTKPFYAGYLLVLLILVASASDEPSGRKLLRGAAVVVGVVLGLAGLLLLLKRWGGLADFFDAQRWNRDVYAGLSGIAITSIPPGVQQLLLMPSGIMVPLAVFAALLQSLGNRRIVVALTIGLLGALLGVILQGKFWLYHGLPMLPFLALLADIGLAGLRHDTAGPGAERFRRVMLGTAVAIALLAPLQQFYRFAVSRTSTARSYAYERREFGYYGRFPGSSVWIVDSLARLEPRSARVMIWAMQPGVFFTNHLQSPTRFAVLWPLFTGEGSAYRVKYRAEFEREMVNAPPRWWLIPSAALRARDPEHDSHRITAYPAMAEFLATRYRQVGASDDWDLYELQLSVLR